MCSGSSRWAQYNHKGLCKGEEAAGASASDRRCDEEAKSEEDVALLALKLEEGTKS